ncbi:MAG TPA: multiheme c-type cytochrome, partial [Bacteroidota bacterium]
MKTSIPFPRSLLFLVLAFFLSAHGQSKLPCQSCHPNEKADWLLGRHANTQSDVAGELAANWQGQTPDSVIFGSAAEDCIACHGPAAIAVGTGMTEVQTMRHFFTTTNGLYTDSTKAADTANWPHVACVSCHNVPSTHPASMPAFGLFNSQTGKYDSVATEPLLCGQCHGSLHFADTDHRIYDAWAVSRHGSQGQRDVAGELAANWAGQSPDSVINGSSAENCIACHAPTTVPQKGSTTEVDALKRFFTTAGGLFTASTAVADTVHWPDVSCATCHNPHNPGALSFYNTTKKKYEPMASSDSLCGQCHGSLRFPDTDHRSYDLESGTGAVGVPDKITMPGAHCVDCHMGKSDLDGMNSKMYKGHSWSVIIKEPDGSSFTSCAGCHAGMTADSTLAVIDKWQAEYQTLDSVAAVAIAKA